MTRASKIVASVILAGILVPSILIGACVVRAKQYGRAYAQVEIGQPQQKIIDTMGNPSEIQSCDGPIYLEGKIIGECAERYIYHSFMEDWGVFFDKNGNVIGKYYNVSG